MRANLPDKSLFLHKDTPFPGYRIEEHIGSGGNGHVFRAYSEVIATNMACKIIPKENLESTSDQPDLWQTEFQKANKLRSHEVVRVNQVDEWEEYSCICVLADYVNGISLKEYLAQERNEITIDFIEDFTRAMLIFFDDMKRNNIRHGDFHTGNILVEDRSDLLGEPPISFRVTDFGVASALSTIGFKDDYHQLSVILKELIENCSYQSLSTSISRYKYDILRKDFQARHLLEDDPTRDELSKNPAGLFEKISNLEKEFQKIESQNASNDLSDPFDYLSCEQVRAHYLLRALYSDHFLGLDLVKSISNVILTGPRGCGKSTVLKSLSIQHLIQTNEDSPNEVEFIGIYYRCDDLYFAFPRYKLPKDRPEAFDIPVHFITASILLETLIALTAWSNKHFAKEFKKQERSLTEKLAKILDYKQPTSYPNFKALIARLNKERKRAKKRQGRLHLKDEPIEDLFGVEILGQCCEQLANTLSYLADRPIFFFIDDYSSPKITNDLQQNLNRLFFQRSPNVFFKLSTESPVSIALKDLDGKVFTESREYNFINIGTIFLHTDIKKKQIFLDDVFRRRFSRVKDYPVGALDELIGQGEIKGSENERARGIISSHGHPKPLWGKKVICDLCSGDIHYAISIVKQMVSNTGGTDAVRSSDKSPRIDPKFQNKAIREEAGRFLVNLKGVKHGARLVNIVDAFGKVAASYLRYRTSKNELGQPPWQASRIEPYEELPLSQEASSIYNELIRYSVFIQDFRGKSKRGNVVPRLYLRRFLIPHYSLTFSKRDSVHLEHKELEQLLLEPQKFETKMRVKNPKEAEKRDSYERTREKQMKLPFQRQAKKDDPGKR